MSTLIGRLLGSATLNPRSYEDVESDSNANLQALAVVVLSSLAAAVGTGIRDWGSTLALLVVALGGWVIWVLLTLLIGSQLLPLGETRVNFGQLLRTTGFSSAPGILRVLGLVPVVGWVLFLAVTVWMLFSFVVAVRQALDFPTTGRALAVCLLGWIIHGIVFFGFVIVAV
jgi:hypothetical protein